MCEMHAPLHSFPCLHCHPPTYIRMVQNLIERCLLLRMDQQQIVDALAHRARIHPLVTLTVWKELQKENKDFFCSYLQSISPSPTPFTVTNKEHQDLHVGNLNAIGGDEESVCWEI